MSSYELEDKALETFAALNARKMKRNERRERKQKDKNKNSKKNK
jgi:hypothetical protein